MILDKFKKIIQLLIEGKIKLKISKIQKKKIIIFDALTLKEIYQKFDSRNISILHTRNEEFNFFIILKVLLKFKFSKISYYEEYIRLHNPKLVISSNEHEISFYKLKKKFPNIIFCMVQNGLRYKKFDDNFDLIKKQKTFLSLDYFFLYNKFVANEYKKYFSFKPIIIGSFKNNLYKIKKRPIFKRSLLFISQFKRNGLSFLHEDKKIILSPYEEKEFWIESLILPIVFNYCIKKKIRFSILGRHSKNDINSYHEYNYFKKILKSNFNFYYKRIQNYKILDNYDTILSIDSFLGYEAISRRKIIYVCGRKLKKQLVTQILWPKKVKKKEGNFYTHQTQRNIIENLLEKNIYSSYKNWYLKNKNLLKNFMPYNYNNKIFYKKINEFLNV